MLTGAGISLHLWASGSPAVKWASDSSCLRAVEGEGVDYVWQCLEILWVVTAGERTANGIQWAEARGAAGHPAVLRSAPITQNHLAPNVSTAEGEKPHSSGLI